MGILKIFAVEKCAKPFKQRVVQRMSLQPAVQLLPSMIYRFLLVYAKKRELKITWRVLRNPNNIIKNQLIRRYAGYDKNTFYMPRQHVNISSKILVFSGL